MEDLENIIKGAVRIQSSVGDLIPALKVQTLHKSRDERGSTRSTQKKTLQQASILVCQHVCQEHDDLMTSNLQVDDKKIEAKNFAAHQLSLLNKSSNTATEFCFSYQAALTLRIK